MVRSLLGKEIARKSSRNLINSSDVAVSCHHKTESFPIFLHRKCSVCTRYSVPPDWNQKDYKFSVNKLLILTCAKTKPVIIENHIFPFTGQELPEELLKINTFITLF